MKKEKQLKVVIPGAEQDKCLDVIVKPGATPIDIQEQVPKIKGMSLFDSANSLPLPEKKDMYRTVKDGSSLYAASYQDVGIILLFGTA